MDDHDANSSHRILWNKRVKQAVKMWRIINSRKSDDNVFILLPSRKHNPTLDSPSKWQTGSQAVVLHCGCFRGRIYTIMTSSIFNILSHTYHFLAASMRMFNSPSLLLLPFFAGKWEIVCFLQRALLTLLKAYMWFGNSHVQTQLFYL